MLEQFCVRLKQLVGYEHTCTVPAAVDEEELCQADEAGEFPHAAVLALHRQLMKRPNMQIFNAPVDTNQPGYTDVIASPMDLGTVLADVQAQRFRKLVDYRDAVVLVFRNARVFNAPNSDPYRNSITAEVWFSQKLNELAKRIVAATEARGD